MKKNFPFKTVCSGDTAYITQLRQKKIKTVLLFRSTLTLWRCAAKVIAPYFIFCCFRCRSCRCYRLF